jgi:hypothetical protein
MNTNSIFKLIVGTEGIELEAESGVLHSQSRMTAEEESRETKQEQHEGRQGTRFSAPIAMKSSRYGWADYCRTTGHVSPADGSTFASSAADRKKRAFERNA